MSCCSRKKAIWDVFNKNVRVVIGNGRDCSFWHDNWTANAALSSLFPDLYQLCDKKSSSVYFGCQFIFGAVAFQGPSRKEI